MHFYLYISKEKVDMLMPQIPMKVKKKVSAKIGFNLGVLTGEIAEERYSLDDKVNRAKTVSDYIINSGNAGEIGSNKPWIKGRMEAYIGHFSNAKSAVFFIGSANGVNLVLGGSTGNLISQQNSSSVGFGQSYLPHLIDMMHSCVESGRFLEDVEHTTEYLSTGVGYPGQRSPWYMLVDQMQEFKKEPLIQIDFLAKTLVYNEDGSRISILASPVYVALH